MFYRYKVYRLLVKKGNKMMNVENIQTILGIIKSIKLHCYDDFIIERCNNLLFYYKIEFKYIIDNELKYLNKEIDNLIIENNYIKAKELNIKQRELLNLYLNIFE